MCQQWFSIAGLILEVIGFLFVAWQWRHVFQHNIALRHTAVERDHRLTKEGEEAARQHQLAVASMWRNTQKENLKDTATRARTFYAGVALVVLGFIGQLVGSLPYGITILGFRSCS